MQISFSEGETGFHEALALRRVVRHAVASDPGDAAEIQMLDALQAAAEAALARPEYAPLVAAAETQPDEAPAGRGWWRRLFGPSRREMLLSAQRGAALERAQRAEQSSFEALAETARVARERDEARARITELEQALAEARRQG